MLPQHSLAKKDAVPAVVRIMECMEPFGMVFAQSKCPDNRRSNPAYLSRQYFILFYFIYF